MFEVLQGKSNIEPEQGQSDMIRYGEAPVPATNN